MLGYGVNAYFDLLYSLMWMCIICSFACIPLYKFYQENKGMGMQLYLAGDSVKLFFGSFTLGNLGGATVHCEHKQMTASGTILDFTCPNSPFAKIHIDDNYAVGQDN